MFKPNHYTFNRTPRYLVFVAVESKTQPYSKSICESGLFAFSSCVTILFQSKITFSEKLHHYLQYDMFIYYLVIRMGFIGCRRVFEPPPFISTHLYAQTRVVSLFSRTATVGI